MLRLYTRRLLFLRRCQPLLLRIRSLIRSSVIISRRSVTPFSLPCAGKTHIFFFLHSHNVSRICRLLSVSKRKRAFFRDFFTSPVDATDFQQCFRKKTENRFFPPPLKSVAFIIERSAVSIVNNCKFLSLSVFYASSTFQARRYACNNIYFFFTYIQFYTPMLQRVYGDDLKLFILRTSETRVRPS